MTGNDKEDIPSTMEKQNQDDEDVSIGNIDDAPDEMTEQIDASFGPMNVYVSGTEQEEVLETFNDVWETMMDTSEYMHERKENMDDDQSVSGRSFSD